MSTKTTKSTTPEVAIIQNLKKFYKNDNPISRPIRLQNVHYTRHERHTSRNLYDASCMKKSSAVFTGKNSNGISVDQKQVN